jgi:Trk K+ transport system NAD-binding subunit
MKLVTMEEIWIIGVGRFGQIAFQRLSKAGKNRHFVLVDPIAENLRSFKGSTASLEVSDGIEFLEKHLTNGCQPDWIIPALPIHLAAEWFL